MALRLEQPDWREISIPTKADALTTSAYRMIPVKTPNSLSNEPLVYLSRLGIASESYYARRDGFNTPYYREFPSALPKVCCRATVANKLRDVNRGLAAYGLEVFVLDGFRPIACQEELWRFFLEDARRTLRSANEPEISAYAAAYCSDPSDFNIRDSRTWPTHVTGGAIDVTLRRIGTGELLYMGGTFDDPSETSHTAFLEDRGHRLGLSELDAQRNRRLLYWSMHGAGFANYACEWWHFDWGTQMWILNRDAGWSTAGGPFEVYPPADPPSCTSC